MKMDRQPTSVGHATEQQQHDRWLEEAAEEEAIEPALPIVDAHHHLWDGHERHRFARRYLIEELSADATRSGHRVVATVYMQSASAGWRRSLGEPALRVVGETEFAQGVAVAAESGKCGSTLINHGI